MEGYLIGIQLVPIQLTNLPKCRNDPDQFVALQSKQIRLKSRTI